MPGKVCFLPVNHGKDDYNFWCGPAVISAATGITTGEAARMIRAYRGRPGPVKGTYNAEVLGVLEQLGIKSRTFPRGSVDRHRVTLAAWLRMYKHERTAGRVFLVSAGRHWQLISGRRYVCGQTRKIVSIRDKSVSRRARVWDVWELLPAN